MTTNPSSPLIPANGAGQGPEKQDRGPTLDPARVLRQYRLPLIVTAVMGFAIGVLLWWVLDMYAPQYTSIAYLMVNDPVDDPWQAGSESGAVDSTRMDVVQAFIENQIVQLSSVNLLQEAVEHPKVKQTPWYKARDTLQERLETMLEDLKMSRLSTSTMIEVSFRSDDQDDPPKILDTILQIFMNRYKRRNDLQDGQLRILFDEEERRLEEQVKEIRKTMEKFRMENDIETLEHDQSESTIEYENISSEVADMKIQLTQLRVYYQKLLEGEQENKMTPTPEMLSLVNADPNIARRKQTISSLRDSRAVLLERYGPNHLSVQRTEEQIHATMKEKDLEMERLLRESHSQSVESVRNMVESLTKQLDTLVAHQQEAQTRMQDLLSKLKEYDGMEEELQSIQEQLDRVRMSVSDEQIRRRRPDVHRIKWVQRATEAEQTFPDLPIMSIGVMLLSVGMVTGLVFLKERLDQRIKTPNDLTSVMGTDLLGVLPEADEDPSGPTQIEGIVHKDPTGLMAESFRQTRSNIISKMERRGYKTLLMCGVQANSGVSAVTQNLAMSAAYNNRRVVVLDANFRRPAQHELFGGEMVPGLVEVLEDSVTLDQAIFHYSKPDVDVIPTGASLEAAPELLEGPAFRNLLIELEKRYDAIFIDGPPAMLASDSNLIARQVDSIILVVRAMSEKRGMVERMLREIQAQRADFLGVILNSVRSSTGGYFRKNYQEFYRYRQANGRDPRNREGEKKEDKAMARS